MDVNTNKLFKSYLGQDRTISKTPSPVYPAKNYKDNVRKSENNALNLSMSNLSSALEQCMSQLKISNEITSKLLDKNFVILEKNKLDMFLSEIRIEFNTLKESIANQKIPSHTHEVKSEFSRTHQNFQFPSIHHKSSNMFNENYPPNQPEANLHKPLTPPSSFEKMLEKGSDELFVEQKKEVPEMRTIVKEEKIQMTRETVETPVIVYKVEKNRKTQNSCKKKVISPSVSVKSVRARMSNTQKWLDSLPMPPKPPSGFNRPPEYHKSIKRTKSNARCNADDNTSDNESVGKWSCRSIRTYKSSRKRGANFVTVRQVAKSEAGWENPKLDRNYGGKFRSEY